jgi:hypothetical protein
MFMKKDKHDGLYDLNQDAATRDMKQCLVKTTTWSLDQDQFLYLLGVR